MAKMFSPGTNRKSCGKTTINGMSACEKIVYTSKQAPGSVTQLHRKRARPAGENADQHAARAPSSLSSRTSSRGTPPTRLFDIPKGYKKVSLPKSAMPSGGRR